MCDHTPTDETVLRQPAAPITPQEIVAHLREAAGAPPGQQSPWEHLVWRFAADAIEALTAENARLTSERDAIKDGFAELLSKYFADFGQVYQPEHYATTDHGWYALHRSKVEADHAAAVQAKRDARRAEGDAALSAVAMRDLVDAAGIDMELLGKLCREEPDDAAKREVDEMMDKLNGGS